ncbi:hypothetical protein FRC01_011372, partial [Tulasnella sp. 417]
MDEDEDEHEEEVSARMGRLSVAAAPSAKARLCIGCKEIPAAGGHMFCSKACKADHSRARAPKPAVSSNQYGKGEDDYDSFEEEDTRDRRKRDPPPARRKTSDRESSGSTSLARRPPMCMFCRRNPKVGDSAFCGRRCMQDAMAELNPRQGPSSGNRKRRDTQNYQYQDPGQMFGDSLRSPDWYQNGYGAAYGQAYPGYNQQQQAYPPPQPSYNVPQLGYPAPQPYYPQMQWPAYPPQPGKSARSSSDPTLDLTALVKQFNDTWGGGYGNKPAPRNGVAAAGNPTIKRVCKVVNTKAVETRYQAYRVCAANGIYTSAFSGVSNGYTRAQSAGSPYKAMFLTRIVVGKRHVGGYAPVAGTDSTAIDNMDSELI